MMIVLAFISPAAHLHNLLIGWMLDTLAGPTLDWLKDVESLLNLMLFIVMFRLFARLIERRSAVELSGPDAATETAVGMTAGGGIITLMVLILWLGSFYSVQDAKPAITLVHAFFFFGIGAFVQELFFRGIVFRHLEEIVGSWVRVGRGGADLRWATHGEPRRHALVGHRSDGG
jgi:membrane protease YdiL (CAAX protease family)